MIPSEPGWVSVRLAYESGAAPDGGWPWCAGRVYEAEGRLEVEWAQRGVEGGVAVMHSPLDSGRIEFGREFDVGPVAMEAHLVAIGPDAAPDQGIRASGLTAEEKSAGMVWLGGDCVVKLPEPITMPPPQPKPGGKWRKLPPPNRPPGYPHRSHCEECRGYGYIWYDYGPGTERQRMRCQCSG